jgi:phage gpG-like protein
MAELSSLVLRTVGNLVVRQIKRRIREGRVEPKTGKPQRTLIGRGHLLASIKYQIDGNQVVISAGGANVPYARIQHEGGIIKPARAKFLAIPLTPKAKLFKPRDYPGTTFIRKGIIFLSVEGKEPEALYALKKSVTLPPRRYMLIDGEDRRIIEQAVSEIIERNL